MNEFYDSSLKMQMPFYCTVVLQIATLSWMGVLWSINNREHILIFCDNKWIEINNKKFYF
jgi:hypothetical protein